MEILLERIEAEKADLILSGGDLGINRLSEGLIFLKNIKVPFKSVRGNCDSAYHFIKNGLTIPPLYLKLSFNNRRLFLTHGDYYYDWKVLPVALNENDVFITGHTHISKIEKTEGSPILLNPGSVTYPRDKNGPTYATIDKNRIQIVSMQNFSVLNSFIFKD